MAQFDVRAPFVPDDEVHPKQGIGMPIPKNYKVDAVMLGRSGWQVLLEGLHIGNDGWLPADNFDFVQGR